jgi:hypothetical protein
VSVSESLRLKLQGESLDKFTDALIDAATTKQNSTAMKIVVDLVEPDKKDQKEETVTDAQLAQLVAEFVERRAEERAQEIVLQQAARPRTRAD